MFQQMDVRVEFLNDEEIVIMIGTTIEGYSVLCRVHGFRPYFYIRAPDTVQRDHCARWKIRCESGSAIHGRLRDNRGRMGANPRWKLHAVCLADITLSVRG
ncbi:LOW QUALITY PROTEIN: hypothetical protein BC938DRAFT_477463 [Jimgerdemannia flammicorona]|uniref:Uncharacterized protein n=1 Tax=Jimgerdemannia flammicorona TaxID=994334 RepID=A0A433P9M8_9FUNG|nr:LOW QUALITY PROTEIN: hypothetical protein BC938DRAFT_477463 [Jimgerdemannia flammicorona]